MSSRPTPSTSKTSTAEDADPELEAFLDEIERESIARWNLMGGFFLLREVQEDLIHSGEINPACEELTEFDPLASPPIARITHRDGSTRSLIK